MWRCAGTGPRGRNHRPSVRRRTHNGGTDTSPAGEPRGEREQPAARHIIDCGRQYDQPATGLSGRRAASMPSRSSLELRNTTLPTHPAQPSARALRSPATPTAKPMNEGSSTPATRRSPGETSRSSSSHFPPISGSKVLNPVMLPPGRAWLCDKARPGRIGHDHEHHRDAARGLLRGGGRRRPVGDDHIGRQRDELGCREPARVSLRRRPSDNRSGRCGPRTTPGPQAAFETRRPAPAPRIRLRHGSSARRSDAGGRAAARARQAAKRPTPDRSLA